jgi:hypothetical protein
VSRRLIDAIRATATRLGHPEDGYGSGNRYMCIAFHQVVDLSVRRGEAFQALLEAQGVSLCGDLIHDGIAYDDDCWTAETQELRFDFLNLLACSLASK